MQFKICHLLIINYLHSISIGRFRNMRSGRLREREINYAYSSFQTHSTPIPKPTVSNPTKKAGESKDQEDPEGLSWKIPVIILAVLSKPRFPESYI